MTKDELVTLMLNWELEDEANAVRCKRSLADRILSALEDEKKGETVLGHGRFYSVKINMMNHNDGPDHVKVIASNNSGQLIFRPDNPTPNQKEN